MDENEKILPAMASSIFEPLPDVGMDYLEIGLDSLLETGPLQEIPIVKTVVSVCKIGMNWHERNLLHQLFAFIQELNSGDIAPEKLQEHKERIEHDPQQFEKELGRITFILSEQLDLLQSKVLGAIYRSYIGQEVRWDKFCELSEANRRIFSNDYKILARLNWSITKKPGTNSLYQLDRLVSIGLLRNKNRIVPVFGSDDGSEAESNELDMLRHFELTSFGKTFCQSARTVLRPLAE